MRRAEAEGIARGDHAAVAEAEAEIVIEPLLHFGEFQRQQLAVRRRQQHLADGRGDVVPQQFDRGCRFGLLQGDGDHISILSDRFRIVSAAAASPPPIT